VRRMLAYPGVTFLLALLVVPAAAAGPAPPQTPPDELAITMPGSPIGAGWFFVYGYQEVPAVIYLPTLRELGGGVTKVYLFWDQIEPKQGQYNWSAVDAFVNQLQSPEEGLIALFSSSEWATRQPAALLPPSPAKNLDDYYRFVYDLVKHCKGKVRYWQNDSEPNNPVYWSGTKEEFVAQLRAFYEAVKDADPSAVVVCGGYDGLFIPPGVPPFPNQEAGLTFFDYVLREGRDAFDVFDLRLYIDPYTIPGRVEYIRQKMRALGYDKPIISTEYGGPNLFEFPENLQYVSLVMSWSQAVAEGDEKGRPANPIAQLYAKMDTLAPQTQMFMLGCPPELDAKYQRIQSRSLVMRNLLAFSAGVQKTLYWDFLAAHGARDDLMTLMYGKIGLVGYADGNLTKSSVTGEAFQRMAKALHGVRQVTRMAVPDRPSIYLFRVDRGARGPLYVVWERRDAFSGEDSPAVPFGFPWRFAKASAVDALGAAVPVQVKDGRLSLPVSLTPIYVEPGS
jgi:hypothetical protein